MQIKNLLLLFFLLSNPIFISSFTIMIDPAGDQNDTGREIYDSFERGLTLQCAHELKKELETQLPNIRVILTRSAGEKFEPLHNARFANKIQPDLYLRIGFYAQETLPCNFALFYYQVEATDSWHKKNNFLFYPINQAYLYSLPSTQKFADKILHILEDKQINPVFLSQGLSALPLTPLIGITSPALYFEAGLHKTTDWKYLIQPLIATIEKISSCSKNYVLQYYYSV